MANASRAGNTAVTVAIGAVRHIWAAPTSILGLLAIAASISLPALQGPIALCRSDRGFAHWFLTKRGYCAITLGHVVLLTPEAPPNVLVHEMVHVRQAERWGPLFLPLYLGSMLVARMRGKNPYWDNPFEVEARMSETPATSEAEQTP